MFTPLRLRGLTLPNRVGVSPMCQYSAEDGMPSDWHLVHLGSRALGGAGLVIAEMTDVDAHGRITPGCAGMYRPEHVAAWRRVVEFVHGFSPAKIGMQLAHAGRKASSRAPWDGGAQVPRDAPGGWQAVAPSALPHAAGEEPPLALDAAGLQKIRDDFARAAARAARLGIDGVEIHAAHGYLLHQFLSPIANRRSDAYGGSLENRMRFPLEIFDVVRAAFPAERPVWARISATDWVPGGWDIDGTVALSKALQARGCAAIHVSSGGVSPEQKIPVGPGYQVPFAARVKAEVGLPTIAVGLITEAEQAEAIVASGQADAVSLARAMLYDPRWPWHAASALGARVVAPRQYWRSQPREVKDLFENASFGAR
jgi:2,4-dienoyl-CoA reductase-like NADH-dependent reductase (Old Yellow Enzyme family)